MKNIIILFAIFSISFIQVDAQESTYAIEFEAINVLALGGIQSYAFGTQQGEWLIAGGRLDGLHRRQPFAAFSAAGNNNQLIVVNPETKEVWKSDLTDLPIKIQEQLSSTNMQFYQDENNLILTGGYAYSPSVGDHITFPYLTVIDLIGIIPAIKQGKPLSTFIQQIEDDQFAVTGGQLEKMNDKYYLVGGQKFMGRYNPMGPNHGPGFIQEYTYEVRPFELDFSNGVTVTHFDAIHDEMHLRRRDYNLLPQINNGDPSMMVFSGVFQSSADIPWLYPISISENSYEPIEDFTQYFNHYHCATLPIYNAGANEMHNIFFGGIAQFYEDDQGVLTQDDDVPFVNTIADVARLTNGDLVEKKLTETMPGLLGAASEFIFMPDAPLYHDGILDGDQIGNDMQTIGYIYGGIKSDLPNIFWVNEGNQSEASSTIYKVSLRKKLSSKTIALRQPTKIMIYPNPTEGIIRLALELEKATDLKINIYNSVGNLVARTDFPTAELNIGMNYLKFEALGLRPGTYLFEINREGKIQTQKVVVSDF